MLVVKDPMCLTVELLSLLLEDLVADSRMLIEGLSIEVSVTARARGQIHITRISKGILAKVRSKTLPILKSRDHLLGYFIFIVISPGGFIVTLLIMRGSIVSCIIWCD